jgi:hypothetical protein
MKYALLAYDRDGTLEGLAAEDKRALHGAHRALHNDVAETGNDFVNVIAHYRFRPARHAKTLRHAGDELVTTEGPVATPSGPLRALYLLESDDPDAVLDLASQLPGVRMGGSVEVWPLTEPIPSSSHGSR